MRFYNVTNLKYWQEKSRIDKKQNQMHAAYILLYQNNLIDEFIKKYFDEDVEIPRPTQAMLYADLWSLNKPQVYEQYTRILDSPYIDNNQLFQMLIKAKADSRLNQVVEAEVSRISKNLDYVEEVLDKQEVNLQEYEKIVKRERKTANRKNIIDRCVDERNYALTEFGINIQPHVNTYRDVDITAEALNRQTQMGSQYDECDLINQQARRQGKDDVYTRKEWIWTNKGKTTRHRGNDGQVVGFYENFKCVHDITGKVDMIPYPCHPSGSFENCWICYCQYRCF